MVEVELKVSRNAAGDDDERTTSLIVDAPGSELQRLPVGNLSSEPTTSVIEALKVSAHLSRKEKRKNRKKMRRSQLRKQAAREEQRRQSALLEDPEEQPRIQLEEQLEAERLATEKTEHDEQERLWVEREMKAVEDFERPQEELAKKEEDKKNLGTDYRDWKYVDDNGPPEIIWEGNRIIVKRRIIRVRDDAPTSEISKDADHLISCADRPTSNPLPPQSLAFSAYSAPQTSEVGEQKAPAFGTEKDKTHCPFHIKTGVCRFGVQCSRRHVYPDQSFTLLMRNMYTDPGLVWENDEGLEHSDEEMAQHYEEFYDDVHSEFLQFGELVNFKVCRNLSSHLRGNVYVHFRTEASAQAAYIAMNGRFYASKQITCEFVGVTRWRIALCGEYMKRNHKPCSHGTACNFLHCFCNPRGEYDWADWDGPPPRYWLKNMAKMFGYEIKPEQDDDEYNEGRRSHYRSPNSPWEGGSRRRDHGTRDRHYHSTRDESLPASRHRQHRKYERRCDHFNSNTDDEETSSRHRRHEGGRSRNMCVSSTPKEEVTRGGDGDPGVHCSDEETVAKVCDEKYKDQRDEPQRIYRSDNDMDLECVPNGGRRASRKARGQFRHDSYEEAERDTRHSKTTRICLKDPRDYDYQQSLDFSNGKVRCSSPSSERENRRGQSDNEAREKGRHRAKKRAEPFVHRNKSRKSHRSRKLDDVDSSSGDEERYHKRDKRDWSTRMDSCNPAYEKDSKEDTYIDEDDRWTASISD